MSNLLPVYNQKAIPPLAGFGASVQRGILNGVITIASTPNANIPLIANRVLGQLIADVGIRANMIPAMLKIHPTIASVGIAAVNNIFVGIKSRFLNKSNVGLFSDPKAVNALSTTNPKLLNGHLKDASNIYGYCSAQEALLQSDPSFKQTNGGSDPLPYKNPAQEMAITEYVPKYKFLFVLEMKMNHGFQMIGTGNNTFTDKMTFVVKSATRPNMQVEYDTVNMYNFRTRVPKTITYEPVTLHFYDDEGNYTMRALMTIMRAISPIFNVKTGTDLEDSGMGWDTSADSSSALENYRGKLNNRYSGALGALQTPIEWVNNQDGDVLVSETTAIEEIKIYHVFNSAQYVNVYTYFNPRVLQFSMDPLSMIEDATNGCEITLQFAYDAMYIDEGILAREEPVAQILKDAGLNPNTKAVSNGADTQSNSGVMSTMFVSPAISSPTIDEILPQVEIKDPLANIPTVTTAEQLGSGDANHEATNLTFITTMPPDASSAPPPEDFSGY